MHPSPWPLHLLRRPHLDVYCICGPRNCNGSRAFIWYQPSHDHCSSCCCHRVRGCAVGCSVLHLCIQEGCRAHPSRQPSMGTVWTLQHPKWHPLSWHPLPCITRWLLSSMFGSVAPSISPSPIAERSAVGRAGAIQAGIRRGPAASAMPQPCLSHASAMPQPCLRHVSGIPQPCLSRGPTHKGGRAP